MSCCGCDAGNQSDRPQLGDASAPIKDPQEEERNEAGENPRKVTHIGCNHKGILATQTAGGRCRDCHCSETNVDCVANDGHNSSLYRGKAK